MDKHIDDFNIFHYNVIIKIHASSQNKKEKEIEQSKDWVLQLKMQNKSSCNYQENDTKGVYINIYYCGLIVFI